MMCMKDTGTHIRPTAINGITSNADREEYGITLIMKEAGVK